jgi:hypothetical protein
MRCRGDRLAHIVRAPARTAPPVGTPVSVTAVAIPIASVPIPVATVAVPIATVPAVATSIPVTTMAVAIAPMPIVAAERPLRLMHGGADGRPDLLPRRLGLGLGAMRCRGDRLAHIPGLATAVAAPVAVTPPAPPIGMAISIATVPAVAAPIPVAAASPPVGMAAPITAAVSISVTADPAVAVPTTPAAAALAGVGPALAASTTVPTTVPAAATTTALGVGHVVVDREEGSRQTAQEWDQCDHDDCHYEIPEERFHGWTLLYDR